MHQRDFDRLISTKPLECPWLFVPSDDPFLVTDILNYGVILVVLCIRFHFLWNEIRSIITSLTTDMGLRRNHFTRLP